MSAAPSINEGYDLIKTIYLLLDDGDRYFLKQYGITPVQYYALLWLDGVERKTLSQLSRDLLTDPGNVTRLTDRLKEKGMITRQRDDGDRRVIWVSLTPAGERLCMEIQQAHAAFTHTRMNALTGDEQATLLELLGKLRDGLEQQLQPSS